MYQSFQTYDNDNDTDNDQIQESKNKLLKQLKKTIMNLENDQIEELSLFKGQN